MKARRWLISRSNRGTVANVLAAITIPSCLAIAAIAVDFGHGVLLRAQLQCACDAAAISGAKDLVGDSGPLSPSQITLAETDANAVGQANFADQLPVSVIVNNPPPAYNSPPYNSTNPQYTVIATASSPMSNIFARIFGCNSEPISASSRAGVFPASSSTSAFGSLASVTAPIAVTINVNANNDLDAGMALSSVVKGQAFKIEADGATGGGAQNASWIELAQGNGRSPLSPLTTSNTLTNQFAAQSNPGIVTTSNGNVYAYVSGAGNNSSTSGNNGWTAYLADQIVANGGSFNFTIPIITDPNGNSNSASLNQNSELQIIGVATFNIKQTAQGPGQHLNGDATFYGTLVNALPLSSADMGLFPGFFGQFQGGNSSGSGSSTQGTPQIRLY